MTRRKAVQIVRPPVTWILVADGGQAQVFVRSCVEKLIPLAGGTKHDHFEEKVVREPAPVPGMRWFAESPEQYQVGRNATGMVFVSKSKARHMSEPRIDARKEVKQHFAAFIAEQIDAARAKERFDRLVLVAPPRMLGEIKSLLAPATMKKVIAEMPKDLTHYEGEELLQHLKDSGLESA